MLRFQSPGFGRPIVVTHENYRFHIVEQMGEIGTLPELILLEPFSRNTAGAALAAATELADRDANALCIVAPSDHLLSAPDGFLAAVKQGIAVANSGKLVTFGITPDRPETGYGYLEICDDNLPANQPAPVLSFTEKPDLKAATHMMASGKHLWNAGIFMFRSAAIKEAFARYAPEIVTHVSAALEHKERDLGFSRLEKKAWEMLPDISLDFAIMERADNIYAVPYKGHWSDLGSWQGLWREKVVSDDTQTGVVAIGNAHSIDCEGSLLMSESPEQTIVGLGLRDLVAVAMRDAVLVADRGRSNDIGAVVELLRSRGTPQATVRPQDYRPWGWFEELVSGPGFKVKLITVHPRGVLSLQSHEHRAEHWVVVEGVASVTIGNKTVELSANQSAYVPTGEVHRLENNGQTDAVLIEVQTGPYLGEDDIVRYEDAYARS